MTIVDAQIHLWSSGKPNGLHRQVSAYTAEEAIRDMDEGGVDAAILHPPGWDPNSGAVAVEAAKKYPSRFAVLGRFPLDQPESRNLIDGWKNQPGMLGLRFTFLEPRMKNWVVSKAFKTWTAHRAELEIAPRTFNQRWKAERTKG